MQKLYQNLLGAVALFVSLVSCGPSPQAGGGIGGTGHITTVASGPITGFGSVFVSGNEYDTGHTSMMIDGKPRNQSDLKKGMLVRVNATVTRNDGTNDPPQRTANTLLYEDTVEGVVQSVAANGSSLVVLGQTVTITTATNVDDSILGRNVQSLVPGRDLVEVSGFVTGDGLIRGTFIGLKTLDLKTETPDYQVKGFIANHKPDQKTFEIGPLTVDYHEAVLNDMPAQSSTLWNGLLVAVTGRQVSAGGLGSSSPRLTATLVWPEGLGSEESEDTALEGIVTKVLGPGNFFLGNVQVLTNVGTNFEEGTANDLMVGAHLEVRGPLVGGIVQAMKVESE